MIIYLLNNEHNYFHSCLAITKNHNLDDNVSNNLKQVKHQHVLNEHMDILVMIVKLLRFLTRNSLLY